eukprot:CAMPEP_0181325016 /NCGR_PEP_ID=MMETSP1101-20121128/20684_1 /TAXON_ID=46948 /ORGANISM="Rhodomonas abbreviata, Strain Caron Lab Isolate" /LENGTH=367 /DNA_ID=CAMNT_0023433263 /DNA_START=64 /DNA_END=1168 /DNA_ORIENTATION=+
MAAWSSASVAKFGVGLVVSMSVGAVSAICHQTRADSLLASSAHENDAQQDLSRGSKESPSFAPIPAMARPRQAFCQEQEPLPLPATSRFRFTQARFFSKHMDGSHPPEEHPWLAAAPAAPKTLLPEERIVTFVVANAAAGKINDLQRDWSYLPPHMHAAGMEALLQNHLLVGFPRTINAIAAVHEVGVSGGSEWKDEEKGDAAFFKARGEEALCSIYGVKYERLRNRMEKLHPVLNSIMAEHAYGRVIAREGALSMRMRELCVISVLAGQDVLPQLQSHLYGARNVGATLDEITAVVAQTELPWGQEAHAGARDMLKDWLAASLARARTLSSEQARTAQLRDPDANLTSTASRASSSDAPAPGPAPT